MGLSVFLQTYNFVASMLMMCDILPVLSQLSRAMQKKDLDYLLVKPLVAATISTVKSLQTQPGVHFSTVDNKFEELTNKPYRFKSTDGQREKFMSEVYHPFLDNIVENLERRFPDLPPLECFRIFDPSLLPEDEAEKVSYGIDSLKTLANHFHCDFEEAQLEWKTVIEYMAMENQRALPTSTTMTHIARQMESFPNIGKIAVAGLLIPTSTADCERGFSTLKSIKTDLRANLSGHILNCLLAISLEDKSIQEFEIEKCVNIWLKEKNRRIKLC